MDMIYKIIVGLLLLAAITVNAYDDVENKGPWSQVRQSNFPLWHDNDYSDDFLNSEYKVYVMCELTVMNVCGNIYLGWLNPDGAKILGENYEMTFIVRGGNGWKFQAKGYFGDNIDDNLVLSTREIINNRNIANTLIDENVFITGSRWQYRPGEGSAYSDLIDQGNIFNGQFVLSEEIYKFNKTGNNPGGIPQPGDSYGNGENEDNDISTDTRWRDNQEIINMWVTSDGFSNSQEYTSNSCEGEAYLKLIPGTVWTSPGAVAGFYTFPVYIEVDYLTFDNQFNIKNDVQTDYSNYSFQENVTP